jgi:SAM-dependent methyltransferase
MAVSGPAIAIDWPSWARRWEDQQRHMVLRREERFEVMLAVAAATLGHVPIHVLDLACGTASISQRGLERYPAARFVAQDLDPLLLAIGQANLGDAGRRLSWVRADLRQADWMDPLREFAPFDAVLTSTALHWLTGTDVLRIYRDLATITEPGGVFLNADRLPAGPPPGRIAQATEALRKEQIAALQVREPAESWSTWWDAAEAEPAFAELIAERNRLFEDNPSPRDLLTSAFHQEALAMAGFAETGVVWRYLDYAVVLGVR